MRTEVPSEVVSHAPLPFWRLWEWVTSTMFNYRKSAMGDLSGGLPGLSGALEDVVGECHFGGAGFCCGSRVFAPAGALRPLTAENRRPLTL